MCIRDRCIGAAAAAEAAAAACSSSRSGSRPEGLGRSGIKAPGLNFFSQSRIQPEGTTVGSYVGHRVVVIDVNLKLSSTRKMQGQDIVALAVCERERAPVSRVVY